MEPINTNSKIIEDQIRSLLETIDNPFREGLLETPKRFRKVLETITTGNSLSGEQVLSTQFESDGYDEMVILKDIDFYSTCEHHLLPIIGKVHIAYIPSDKVVGISKLARLVDVYARRLQIQERMTRQIANDINNVLKPKGVAVIVKAIHMCIRSRGVQKQNTEMITSSMLGVFREKPEARTEFLELLK